MFRALWHLPPPDNLESLIIKLLRRSVKYLVPMYVVGWLLYLFASYTVASDNAILHSVKGTVWFGNWYWYLKVLTIFSLLSIPVMYKSKIWIDLLCICCAADKGQGRICVYCKARCGQWDKIIRSTINKRKREKERSVQIWTRKTRQTMIWYH